MSPALAELAWPLDQLPDGLAELARRTGLQPQPADLGLVPETVCTAPAAELPRWLDWAGQRLAVELQAVETPVPAVPALLRSAAPALLVVHDGDRPVFVLLLGHARGRLRLLAPDQRVRSCPADTLRAALCHPHEAPLLPGIESLLQAAGVPAGRRPATTRTLLAERLATMPMGGCWLLRQPAGAPAWQQLRHAGMPRRAATLLALMAAAYATEIAGWRLIGEAALQGRLDMGWLAAWLLLLFSLLPLRWLGGWVQGHLALDAGRLLKQRLLAGALRMDLDTVRRSGVGTWLGRVMESQALESQGLAGAIGVAVSLLELAFAAWVLAQGATPGWHLSLLAGWLLLGGVLGLRFHRRLAAWSATRLAMTQALVERMAGHRTRLAQEQPARRDAEEDRELHGYLQASAAMDGAVVPVVALAPGGWILLGLAGLAPAIAAGSATPALLAISLGGILFAHRALGGVSGGLAALARAAVAWRQAAPLFQAAATAPPVAAFVGAGTRSPDTAVSEASAVDYRYRPQGEPVLQGLDLRIAAGDRILLEGPSGGGKSTLAALLVGLREPTSGLLLQHGLDRPTLGDAWRDGATEAPQFHDNHVLAGTLAFNLLLGRDAAFDAATLAEARVLCEELGLGPLLQRMPAGLQQRVGETGWQLSHGEQSRLFLARALLQKSPLTLLDESFAALDPQTLRRCLDTALRRTQALVVIAHP